MAVGNESCKHNRKSGKAGATGDVKLGQESRGQGSERFGKARDGSGRRISCQLERCGRTHSRGLRSPEWKLGPKPCAVLGVDSSQGSVRSPDL